MMNYVHCYEMLLLYVSSPSLAELMRVTPRHAGIGTWDYPGGTSLRGVVFGSYRTIPQHRDLDPL